MKKIIISKSFKVFSKIMAISFAIIIIISLLSCGSSQCTTKATSRSGGYYINR